MEVKREKKSANSMTESTYFDTELYVVVDV